MKRQQQKGFVWYGIRIAFLLFIGFSILAMSNLVHFVQGYLFGFLFFTIGMFIFVVSIIHLNIHKEKSLAIVGLVLASLFLITIVWAIAYTPTEYSPIKIEDSGSVSFNNYLSQEIAIPEPSYLNFTATTSNPTNIYLLTENEYLRYEEGEQSYSVFSEADVISFSNSQIYVNSGYYYLVFESINDSFNYGYSLDIYNL